MELKGKVERGTFDLDGLFEAKREKLSEVLSNRARSVANSMTAGLHAAAEQSVETAKITGMESAQLETIAEDAKQVQFEVQEGPPLIVDGVEHRSATVTPSGEVGESGLTPEQVGRAFEFGSVAHGVLPTSFARQVLDDERRASAEDIEEVAKAK